MDAAPHTHGILRHSDLESGEYQEGDQVWLFEGAGNWAINRDKEDKIKVVNLRTWQERMIALDRVLWVPMYRRLGHDGTEELITLAGPSPLPQEATVWQDLQSGRDSTGSAQPSQRVSQ